MSAGRPARPVWLFDLDGTLSDSAPGIHASMRAAFLDLGLAPLTPATERAMIGPPFRDSLPPFIGEVDVEDVIARYRHHYAGGGIFDTTVYPGIPAVLDALSAMDARIALATSKAEVFAPAILAHLGLAAHFEVVCGDDPDAGRATKAAVIGEALRRLGRPDPSGVVMVGDRSHDVHGAAAHGIPTLGAGWGYGGPGELAAAGARAVYDEPGQLLGGHL